MIDLLGCKLLGGKVLGGSHPAAEFLWAQRGAGYRISFAGRLRRGSAICRTSLIG
jgi:hypothetical protein